MTKPVKYGWISRRDYEDEIVDLERQIAEKDKEIADLKAGFIDIGEWDETR